MVKKFQSQTKNLQFPKIKLNLKMKKNQAKNSEH